MRNTSTSLNLLRTGFYGHVFYTIETDSRDAQEEIHLAGNVGTK